MIGAAEACAVALQRGKVVWHQVELFDRGAALTDVLAAVLDGVPAGPVRTAGAFVVLGPSHAQLRAVSGLPELHHRGHLDAMVAANPAAFFLVGSGPLQASSVAVRANGQVWAAAFDIEVLRAIEQACARARIRLHGVTPAIAALAAGAADGAYAWWDQDVRVEATVLNGEVAAVTRTRGMRDEAAATSSIVSPDTGRAAAALRIGHPFMWQPEADERLKRVRRARRIALTTGVIVVAAGALAAPTARLLRAASAVGVLPVRQPLGFTAAPRELARVSADLDQIQRFIAARRSAVRQLASITEVMPESTALVVLRLDSIGGSFTALSPHVAGIIPALARADDVTAPRLAGAVTRELMSGAMLERAAVRFRWTGGPALPHPRAVPTALITAVTK